MRFAHPEETLDWPAPNRVDPVTRGPEIYIINSIFLLGATIAVWTRLYIRYFIRKFLGWDDFLIAFAWFCAIGDVATVYYGYHKFQWDRHFWDATHPENLVPGAKTVYIAKIFWACASNFIRLSLLAFFYRLIHHVEALHRPLYRWTLHVTTFYVIAIYITYMCTNIWTCARPDQYFQWPGEGYCINEGYALTALSALNTSSEFLVATLPIPVILSLNMAPTQRNTCFGLLCLGYLVGVVGCVRTHFVWLVFETNDLTWYSSPHWICSEVEICLAMMCASAPALRPYVGRLFRRNRRQKQSRSESRSTFSSRKLSKSRSQSASAVRNSSAALDEAWATQTKWQFDLEGIGVDDFGYTVTVTGGRPGSIKASRGFLSFRKGRFLSGVDRRGQSESHDTLTVTERAKRLVGQGSSRHLEDTAEEKGPIEIITRRTLEQRESFDSAKMPKAWVWDHRNPYKTTHLSDGGSSDLRVVEYTPNHHSLQSSNFYYEDSDGEDGFSAFRKRPS